MTAAEVKNAVALLGFNPELSDEEEHARFWATLNMVIPTVAQYAPVERSVTVAHMPIKPSFVQEAPLSKPYRGEVSVEIPNAVGIYFEVIGTGEAELSRSGFTHHITWSGLGTYEAKRFIVPQILGDMGDVTVRFAGELAYNVRNLCAYDTLSSFDPNELQPPHEWAAYDMAELCDDFADFSADPVRVGNVRQAPAYRIVSRSVIELATERSGVVEVCYRHKPRVADADHESETLDLEPTLHHLVPLLVAHYLWMDDEPAKAAQYKANYDEQLALWRMRPTPAAHPQIINATRW